MSTMLSSGQFESLRGTLLRLIPDLGFTNANERRCYALLQCASTFLVFYEQAEGGDLEVAVRRSVNAAELLLAEIERRQHEEI